MVIKPVRYVSIHKDKELNQWNCVQSPQKIFSQGREGSWGGLKIFWMGGIGLDGGGLPLDPPLPPHIGQPCIRLVIYTKRCHQKIDTHAHTH